IMSKAPQLRLRMPISVPEVRLLVRPIERCPTMSKLLHGLRAGVRLRHRGRSVEAAGVGAASRPFRRLLRPVTRRRLLIAVALPRRDVWFELRRVRVRMARGIRPSGQATGLQFAPLTVVGLLMRRWRAVALLSKTTLVGRRCGLLLPAVRLRRLCGLSLRVNPGGLARTLRVCGAGNWPPRVRPWKSVLRGHRENPLIPGAGTARVRLMIRDFNASRRAPRPRGF